MSASHGANAPASTRAPHRRRWRGVLLALAMLLLATILLLLWLLHSTGGRDTALAWLADSLPAGSELTWARASGTLAGGVQLHDVRLQVPMQGCVADASLCVARLDAVRLGLRLTPRALLARRVAVTQFRLENAMLTLPERDTPFTLPQWPDLLPTLDLPVGVTLDDARITALRIRRGQTPLLDIGTATLQAQLDPGALTVHRLQADTDRGRFTLTGHYRPRQHMRTDLTATWARPGAVAALVARGDLARMDVAVSACAPSRARLWLRLEGTAPVRWRARATSMGFDPARLLGDSPDTPLTLALDAAGEDGRARVQGRLTRGDLVATLQPSQLELQARRIRLHPLVLDLYDGRIIVNGLADLREPTKTVVNLAVNARGLRWTSTDGTTTIAGDADLGVDGTLARWSVKGQARLQRGNERATVDWSGLGHRDGLWIDALTATMPQGRLQASGEVTWAPRLSWTTKVTLAGFDPGYFAPDWPGAVNGAVVTSGVYRDDGRLLAELEALELGGHLRKRRLSGHGVVSIDGDTYRGDLALHLGASRIEAHGRIARTIEVDATFAPLHLDDLLPDGRGALRGRVALRGPRTAPDLDIELQGDGLAVGGYRVEHLVARGALPWSRGTGQLVVDAHGLEASLPFTDVQATLRGAVERLQVDARAQAGLGTVALRGDLGHDGSRWSGTLDALTLTPSHGAVWTLERPLAWQQNAGRWQLDEGCLRAGAVTRACVRGTWPAPGLSLDATGVPLALLEPWWTPRRAGLDADWRGHMDVHAQLGHGVLGWQGTVALESHDLALRTRGAAYDTLATPALALTATLAPQGYDAVMRATLAGGDCGQRACAGGPMHAVLRGGWSADDPLVGQLDLDTDSVTWLELLSPDLVSPQGRLTAQLLVAGTLATPLLSGEAHLDGLDAELPALAIGIHQGRVDLIAAADGSATLHGALPTGRGALAVTGTLDWHDAATPLSLRLQGSNVLVADTPALTAVVSPDLRLDWQRGAALRLAGRVDVDKARMDLQRLDLGVSASPDVVVLDPADPDRTPDTPLALDLQLVLGDAVTLSGYGLDGRLGGTLAVKGGDGVPMRGDGEIKVSGRYRAYGSELDISKGQLWWRNDPLDNPQVSLRAERRIGDVTAGLDVSGRLAAPRASAWTDPASSEQDALAYLTLGRPLSSLSASDAGKVDAAQAALSAGGGLLASQLAAKLGLDDAGVSDSRALGGQVFGIGKQLSPRLYVSYGVSLLGSGQVVLLRYLLGRGFDVQIESSTRESRGSLNWRKEK